MKKQHVVLKNADRKYLESLLSKGELKARKYRRAQALLDLDKGDTYSSIASRFGMSYGTISDWAKKYPTEGLSFLDDKVRSGRPIKYTGEQQAKIIALACSEPPEGYARWSLRLLSDRAIELSLVESVSFKQVGNILKKIDFNLTESDNGV